MPTRLHAFDLVLIVVYLLGITLFGLRFRKSGDKSLASYFLAERSVPWWAIALSIVSAETSTLTIISVPGIAFGGNFTFLQLVFGYMVGRIVICILFLPRYFDGELFTAYQLIDKRFGRVLHKVTAGLFLLTRAAAEGVRVYAVSIVVGIAIGTNDIASIVIISLLTLLYTFEGGMAAVIWTDVVQMGLYVAGTVIALFTLGSKIDGGWTTVHAITGAAGKLQVFNLGWNLTTTYTFWAGLIGGAFLTMASHGTDQLMVQRLLAARNLRDARVSLLASGGVVFLQFTLFLVIGAGLFVFYGQHPALLTVKGSDRLFPAFIVQQMPVGIAGLLIAAILAAAMSNLSAALNSLSSTTIIDFYLHMKPNATDKERNFLSRVATVFWAAILIGIAIYSVQAGGKGHVVELGLSIASVAYGALLGVFLLGTLTKYATQAGAVTGLVAGFALNLALFLPTILPVPSLHIRGFMLSKIAYTWYVLLGSVTTFVVGSVASLVMKHKRTAVAAVLLVLVAGAGSASAQTYNFSEVDTVMQAALAAKQLPGGVVVVGSGGKVVFHKAYGNRAEDPAIEAATEDTIYDMASLSKCISTSVAIMQMYEAGKLQFDDPVVKYLPEFAPNGKSNITVRQLLTHYSGLKEDVSLTDAWSGKLEGVKRAMESAPYGPPGLTFKYSDINFITLGAIVEKLSGEPLNVYAAKHIFAPMGMVHTTYNPLVSLKPLIAPTAHNDDKPMADDRMLRGEVHDPTTRRMGGVAGHAGVFSSAADVSLFAQALLDRLAGRPSTFPLKQSSLELMCRPEQPTGAKALRAYGWDVDSPFSRPRGEIYPVGSFGHTGFTGTSIWMDPRSDSYVILLANAVHPRGRGAITPLRGKLATVVARALQLDKPLADKPTLTGIDVLEATNFRTLYALPSRTAGHLKLGLLTNNTGLDRNGKRTIDVLAAQKSKGLELTTLFAPEHGILGAEDKEGLGNAVDAATRLPVVSLYGAKLEDRKPKAEDLQKLDAILIDLQDAGARFYTYETEMAYVLESAAKTGTPVVVLDRPALISGVMVTGPKSDPGTESYINYGDEPMSLGLTMGELAGYFNGERHLGAKLTVVPMQHWQRGLWYDQTGLPWVNPSPNLQSLSAATTYTGVAFAEMSNLSVGRGTDAAFEQVGAAWIANDAEAQKLADTLNARKLVGVTFAPVTFTPAKPYPFAGQTIHGVRATVTDRTRFDAPAMGAELLGAVHAQYPTAFSFANAKRIILNDATMQALAAGKDPHDIAAAWEPELWKFRERRQQYLLYGYLPTAEVPEAVIPAKRPR
ncbi:SSS sodium solute transporter [Terriglobus roseus DSM 18391]|uniref:SSS sodium solute transporter n=1 Tax=Terriglobus roseus (strain DSM 18391 / NRRL B-41598 / KBS 63) TaxID=926566 RepID=I3ZFE2_TERRK|nr:sodium/solute symporter [Terriglobus roseus]AFL87960.1 SSS sodium solute transporter [Terriglobus roseus DSM 18391]